MLPKNIFSQHKHIGIDLDETLASTFSGMLRVAHSRKKLLHCSSIDAFFIHDIYEDPFFEVSKEDVFDIWHEYNMRTKKPTDTDLVDGASAGMACLLNTGLQCSIVTARNGNDPLKRKITNDWVHHYFPRIALDDIHFVNHYSDEALPKSVVCKNLGITLLIDDHIDNARDITSA
jgi:5'(3')-deoxyribonucleotidase